MMVMMEMGVTVMTGMGGEAALLPLWGPRLLPGTVRALCAQPPLRLSTTP